MVIESPFLEWRINNHLTQEEAADALELSKATIRQIEAGTFTALPAVVLDFTDVTETDYQDYRTNCRVMAGFTLSGNPAWDSFDPERHGDFFEWIEALGYPTLNSFCNDFKVRPRIVTNFASGKTTHVPSELLQALRDAEFPGLSKFLLHYRRAA